MHFQNQDDSYMLVLKKDQNLVESITHFATDNNVLGGRIHGIGALKNVQLGYYELHDKTYVRQTFQNEDFELLSLHGNISRKEGSPYVHVHTSLGRADFSVIGGHLFEAQVAVTCEIFITPVGSLPEREYDADIGLHLICGLS